MTRDLSHNFTPLDQIRDCYVTLLENNNFYTQFHCFEDRLKGEYEDYNIGVWAEPSRLCPSVSSIFN